VLSAERALRPAPILQTGAKHRLTCKKVRQRRFGSAGLQTLDLFEGLNRLDDFVAATVETAQALTLPGVEEIRCHSHGTPQRMSRSSCRGLKTRRLRASRIDEFSPLAAFRRPPEDA
jgi:hypothetical protein